MPYQPEDRLRQLSWLCRLRFQGRWVLARAAGACKPSLINRLRLTPSTWFYPAQSYAGLAVDRFGGLVSKALDRSGLREELM
jgi:hypothetical protein